LAGRAEGADPGHFVLVYGPGAQTPPEQQQAWYWLRKAAEVGQADAQCGLGMLYETGQGVTQDANQAVYWYGKAAEQGLAQAQLNLGQIYDTGQGVPRDPLKAASWYLRAAERGLAVAQWKLGAMYMLGDGLAEDYVKACMWLRLAAKAGEKAAGQALDVLSRDMIRHQTAEAQRLAASFQPLAEGPAPPAGQGRLKTPPAKASTSKAPPAKASQNPPTGGPRLKGTATGLLVSAQGHVLTNLHVLKLGKGVRAVGHEQPLRLIAIDSANDLALLQLPPGQYRPAAFRTGSLIDRKSVV
jgi:hypothetical protein